MKQSVSQKSRNLSRLESERNATITPVHIRGFSADRAIAYVSLATGGSGDKEQIIEARIIHTGPISIPLNTTDYTGILLGDTRSPIGVLLMLRSPKESNIRGTSDQALYGSGGGPKRTPEVNKEERKAVNTEQKTNFENLPTGQTIVIKPTTPLPEGHIGLNPFVADPLVDLIDEAGPHLLVGEDEVRAIADSAHGLTVSQRNGICMSGPINIGCPIDNVRVQGAWKFNPMLQFQIPSTAVTPIPTLIFDFPGKNILKDMDKYNFT